MESAESKFTTRGPSAGGAPGQGKLNESGKFAYFFEIKKRKKHIRCVVSQGGVMPLKYVTDATD